MANKVTRMQYTYCHPRFGTVRYRDVIRLFLVCVRKKRNEMTQISRHLLLITPSPPSSSPLVPTPDFPPPACAVWQKLRPIYQSRCVITALRMDGNGCSTKCGVKKSPTLEPTPPIHERDYVSHSCACTRDARAIEIEIARVAGCSLRAIQGHPRGGAISEMERL